MTTERFSADAADAAAREEMERTGVQGLPLFEWARSERVRREGAEEMRRELNKPKPDFRYVAEVASVLAGRYPRSVEPPPAASSERVEGGSEQVEGGVDVGADLRTLAANNWEDGLHIVRRSGAFMGGSLAGSMRTLDPERFDREVSADDRDRLWREAQERIAEDQHAPIHIRLMELRNVQRLNPERFEKEIVGGAVWKDIRAALGSIPEHPSDRFVHNVALAKDLFGQDAADLQQRVVQHWENLRWAVEQRARLDPFDAWMFVALQKVAPEGAEPPRCTRAQWEEMRNALRSSAAWMGGGIYLTHLAALRDLVVEGS